MLKVNKNNQFGPKSGLNGLKMVENKLKNRCRLTPFFKPILSHFKPFWGTCVSMDWYLVIECLVGDEI